MSLDSLRDRFRGVCADRVRQIRRALEQAGASPSIAALRDALGELHTIKGESAMVGFSTISELAHALEELIANGQRADSVPTADVLAALGVLEDALQQPPDALLADPELLDLLTEVREAVKCAPQVNRDSTPQQQPEVEKNPPADTSPHDPSVAPRPERAALRWTRVDAERVNALCEGLAEVALDIGRLRGQLAAALARAPDREGVRQLQPILHQAETACAALDEVTAQAWTLRLVSVGPAFEDLMMHGRALAESMGKQVDIEVSAAGVELERNLLDELHEPLMHILRNAIDHGIELPENRGAKSPRARVRLTAEAQGGNVVLSVEDDGTGMDLERIRARAIALQLLQSSRAPLLSQTEVLDLVFLAGFTQRQEANSLSGRGMGLFAARRKVEGLGGSLRVESVAGRGTRFELTVASVLSKERVLLIDSGGARFGIPSRWVRAVVRDTAVLANALERRTYRHSGEMLRVSSLAGWLQMDDIKPSALLVVEIAEHRGAILVGRVVGEHDLLRRGADSLLAASGRVVASGTTDDGSVVLVLRWADLLRDDVRAPASAQPRQVAVRQGRVLVVDDSPVVRDILSDVLAHAGLAVDTAPDGVAALERLQSAGIDLVISDLEMPRMDGLELLENIRRRTEALPVIMLTTRSSPEDRRKAAALGANAYVIKSEFQGSTLIDVVRRFVELRA